MSWSSIFINPQRHTLRSGWRVAIFFFILIALTLVFGLAVRLIQTGGGLTQAPTRAMTPLGFILHSVLSIITSIIASVICLRAFDSRPLRSLGYQLHAGWWQEYLLGVGAAALMITAIVGVEQMVGTLSLDLSTAPAGQLLSSLVISLVFFHLAAMFEELAFRGYPLQTLLQDVPPAWAVLITSTLFGLAHLLNPHTSLLSLFNTVLAGVWLAVAYVKTRRLWLCTGLHWSWNWTMHAIYGLNVSGLEGITPITLLSAHSSGPEWLTGGQYGPEGGVLVTSVVSVCTVVLWRIPWVGCRSTGQQSSD